MSTVVDASSLVAFFVDDTRTEIVAQALQSGDCIINAVNLAETVDVMTRRYGADPDQLASTIESLTVSRHLSVVRPTKASSLDAGALRARIYNRVDCQVSMGDCFLLVTVSTGDSLMCFDALVNKVARAEGITITDCSTQ